jgi:hypothetical protein
VHEDVAPGWVFKPLLNSLHKKHRLVISHGRHEPAEEKAFSVQQPIWLLKRCH